MSDPEGLTPEREARLRELLEADTAGRVDVEIESCDCGGGMPCGHPDYAYALHAANAENPWEHAAEFDFISIETAQLLAEARNALPALLAELDRLRVKRQSLAAQLAEAADRDLSVEHERDQLRAENEAWQQRWQEQFARAEQAEAQIPHPDHLTIDISDLGRGLDPGDLIRLDNHRDGTQTTLHVIAVTQPDGVRHPQRGGTPWPVTARTGRPWVSPA